MFLFLKKVFFSLRETLIHLRRRQRTTINFKGNGVLRNLLPRLEAARGGMASASTASSASSSSGDWGGGNSATIAEEHVAELKKLNAAYKVRTGELVVYSC